MTMGVIGTIQTTSLALQGARMTRALICMLASMFLLVMLLPTHMYYDVCMLDDVMEHRRITVVLWSCTS